MAMNGCMYMDINMHVHTILFMAPHGLSLEIGGVGLDIYPNLNGFCSTRSVCRPPNETVIHSIAANLIHGRWTQARFGGTTLGRRKGPGERNAVPPHLARVPITNMVPAPSGGHSHGYTWRHRSMPG